MLALRLTDQFAGPTTAAVDSDIPELVSGVGWTATRAGAPVDLVLEPVYRLDPRFHCARARPHPLPGAGWLDPAAAPGPVVVPLVPDLAPTGNARNGCGSPLHPARRR